MVGKIYTVGILRNDTYGYSGPGAGSSATVRALTPVAAAVKAARLLGVCRRGIHPPQLADHNDSHQGCRYALYARFGRKSHMLIGLASVVVVEGVTFDSDTPAEIVADYAASI